VLGGDERRPSSAHTPSRYVTYQLAEVRNVGRMSAAILSLIAPPWSPAVPVQRTLLEK
jgi:hypothetical protein